MRQEDARQAQLPLRAVKFCALQFKNEDRDEAQGGHDQSGHVLEAVARGGSPETCIFEKVQALMNGQQPHQPHQKPASSVV